jgi:hypothetical protein
MPYATVIVGAMPIKPIGITGGAIISSDGAYPVIFNAAPSTKIVLDNTSFKNPPSFQTVPGLWPTGLVGSANNVN